MLTVDFVANVCTRESVCMCCNTYTTCCPCLANKRGPGWTSGVHTITLGHDTAPPAGY